MPLIQTKGAASAQGFGEFASTAANYIEDVFQTWLYTGNSSGASTQTITNGVDLAGKGGLVFAKGRSAAGSYPYWIDSARGVANELASNFTAAQTSQGLISSFNSNGFTLGTNNGATNLNRSGDTYVSWTFRKQPKFFDVVTWTGDGGTGSRTISHALGSVPGCVIAKSTSTSGAWYVQHRSVTATGVLLLNSNEAVNTDSSFNNQYADLTSIYLNKAGGLNLVGITYVAYLFAHDAGGFGASGTDNVISCGSYTGNGSTTGPLINLGWEPQWLLIKQSSVGTSDWVIVDVMRGMTSSIGNVLTPNTSSAESNYGFVQPTATGFQLATVDTFLNGSGSTYIYIAIRRGPMRTPTTGTSVFLPNATTNDNTPFDYGFPIDALWEARQSGSANNTTTATRLSGNSSSLITSSTAAAGIFFSSLFGGGNQNSYQAGLYGSGIAAIQWAFRRAPGFFDVVCYTGDGNNPRTISHNLTAVPQLMIVKTRSAAGSWYVYDALDGAANAMTLESSGGVFGTSAWSSTTPTSSVFTIGNTVNGNGITYVAYLFATLAGVSKVGSYTGTGTTLQVNCGFTGGARFVLIKRTDSTGDWYVWDSARGIVAGNDPYLLLNSTAAEVTGTDYVDTFSSGFEISSTAPAAINANGGTFIFLAVA